MPAHKPDALDLLDLLSDVGRDWTPEAEQAVYILASLDAPRWEALRALAQSHVRGCISLAAWKSAVWDIIITAARRRDTL